VVISVIETVKLISKRLLTI